jgi:hypothetical protein
MAFAGGANLVDEQLGAADADRGRASALQEAGHEAFV